MKSEDVHLVHRLWLNITKELGMDKLHHSDIVTVALTRFARDYAGRDHREILRELKGVHLKEKDGALNLPEPPGLAAEPPPLTDESDRPER
jgi:hypothetical protein